MRGRRSPAVSPCGWAVALLDAAVPLYAVGGRGHEAGGEEGHDRPLSYAQDEKALGLALEGIDAGMDQELSFAERIFFWMPLGHSEDLAINERAVRHQEEEMADPPAHLRAEYEFGIGQARGAHGVITRFGRYPHRNEILGRDSTPEELEYLRTETPVHLRRPPI